MRFLKIFIAVAILSMFVLVPSIVFGQNDTVYVAYGNTTGEQLEVDINQRVEIPVYIFTGEGNDVGDMHICLGTKDQYIDSLLSTTEGEYYYPLTEWDGAYFNDPYGSPPNPEGWSSQSLMAWAQLDPTSEAPWFNSLGYYLTAKFVVKTANDSLNIGDDAVAIGPGENPYQGPSNIGDTMGIYSYLLVESFPTLHFIGGGYVEGTITDYEGNPVEGVSVSIDQSGKEVITDSLGFYHMGHYPGTNFDITFYHADYEELTQQVSIVETETVTMDLSLDRLGIITGIVINCDDAPLSGVEVIIDEDTVTTDTDGWYEFRGLTPDSYDVSFSYTDYVDTTVTGIETALNTTTTVNMMLHMLAGISGTVTFVGTNEPLEGIEVGVVGEPSLTATTDSLGYYALELLEPGSYDIYFEDPTDTYDEDTVTSVTVAYDVYTTVDIALEYWTGINDENLPYAFNLDQNYPNPFNAVTTIEYSLNEDVHVTLEVYDILGRKVETLVNEQQQTGVHQITWNAGSTASGMYFYRIAAGDKVEQKSMILLK